MQSANQFREGEVVDEQQKAVLERVLKVAKAWKTIYPHYINAKLTYKQGRRLPLAQCVANPNVVEMAEAIQKIQLRQVVEESKAYPREWLMKGRIKVELLQADKRPFYAELSNKKKLLQRICEVIKASPARKQKPDGQLQPGSKDFCLKQAESSEYADEPVVRKNKKNKKNK